MVILQTVISAYHKKTSESTLPLMFMPETFSEHLAGIGDAPHAHEPLAAHAHVFEVPVLSGPHVHHLASELGLLVHQPVTVHHVAGLALVHAVTIHDVVTVLHHLVTLTTEVLLLIDLHPELASVLLWGEEL
ncbi:hypothetical protein F7725_002412 [Dissostichus mawsoni]|uniref:Uncharacterized protein n=1 Tax=Dissostichus mawsoni TaxID=36200 RepID=A0A7J5Y3A9_DISMA|nr:hypothetical protein F7725_002412 [Dissostichus mawsoni]